VEKSYLCLKERRGCRKESVDAERGVLLLLTVEFVEEGADNWKVEGLETGVGDSASKR
jgi:hypothetical protein